VDGRKAAHVIKKRKCGAKLQCFNIPSSMINESVGLLLDRIKRD